jgi:hypothetical protein
MEGSMDVIATASALGLGAARRRSFQRLTRHDTVRLEAFFLSLDFDQRRGHFAGGLSDGAVRTFCRRIDWGRTMAIGRSGAYCLEAVALLSDIPPDNRTAELSMVCPLDCDRSEIVRDLFDLAMSAASSHRELLVHREFAMPELLRLIHERSAIPFGVEEIRLIPDSQVYSSGGSLPL